MTRSAVWMGAATGVVCLLGGLQGYLGAGSGVSLVVGTLVGAVLLAASVLTRRGSGWGQVLLTAVALLLLGGFLVAYFQTYRIWPPLVMVGLASLTFGLGLLGLVLDRYRPPGEEQGL